MNPTPARRPFLKRLWNLPRSLKRRLVARLHADRVRNASVSPDLLRFWRDHGREWAMNEASPADLAQLTELSGQLAGASGKERQSRAIAAFQKIWNAGFSNPAEAFPWDGMKEDLPSEAMLAFLEGALSAKFGQTQPR